MVKLWIKFVLIQRKICKGSMQKLMSEVVRKIWGKVRKIGDVIILDYVKNDFGG